MSGGKADKTVELPASCSECLFFHPEREDHCHRHSPSPGDHAQEIAEWPPVREKDWCGRGALPTEDTVAHIACNGCVYWERLAPGFKPIRLQGKSPEWWAKAGICHGGAPSPSREKRRHPVEWPVTHADEGGCGDGAAPAPETMTGALTLMAVD